MIAYALALLAFTAFTWYHAPWWSRYDADCIAKGHTISHALHWTLRAMFHTIVWVITVWIVWRSWWSVLPLVGNGFLFSARFRYRLNPLRKEPRHRCYIAPWSNVYDFIFYWAVSLSQGYFVGRTQAEVAREFYFTIGCPRIHMSGRTAYVAEALLFTVGIVWPVIQYLRHGHP